MCFTTKTKSLHSNINIHLRKLFIQNFFIQYKFLFIFQYIPLSLSQKIPLTFSLNPSTFMDPGQVLLAQTSQGQHVRSFTEVKFTPVVLVCIQQLSEADVTHDILHTVFSTYGRVVRILIFELSKKCKAFVEFEDVLSAIEARTNLDEFLLFSDGTRMNVYPTNIQTIKL